MSEVITPPPPASTTISNDPGPEQPSGATPSTDSSFFKSREFAPQYELQKEEPQHRFICMLAAQGYTNTEIAKQTSYSPVTVAYVKKQTWAVEYIAKLQREAGREAVIGELKGAQLDAARAIIDVIRNKDGDAKANDRTKAANSLLDRLYPQAQLIMHGKIDPSQLTDEELAQIANGTSTATNS